MRTCFTVDITPKSKIEVSITQEGNGVTFELDAIDAMELVKLLEGAAVAVQAKETGARPS